VKTFIFTGKNADYFIEIVIINQNIGNLDIPLPKRYIYRLSNFFKWKIYYYCLETFYLGNSFS